MEQGICEIWVSDKERYEAESWVSSEKTDLGPLRSYESLEFLSCPEDDDDDDDCRWAKLNNTIKRLVNRIRDPLKRDNVRCISSLLRKFFEFNGNDGLYLVHLPFIGEIMEFACEQFKDHLNFLYRLLELCCHPPMLRRGSEVLKYKANLRRHFSQLGCLLVLAPTRDAFLGVKCAIESLLKDGRPRKRNTVKPDAIREAVEGSRLPVTLAEILKVASSEVYPMVLSIALTVVDFSPVSCYRVLEARMDDQIMLRMHPAYENGFGCDPVTDDTDLQLNNEDYYKSLECGVKILWRVMTSMVVPEEVRDTPGSLKRPSNAAMWSVRAALRREVLRASRSAKSRVLRNYLAVVILENLLRRTQVPEWELVESGIAEDLGVMVAASECGTKGTWAERAVFETKHLYGLDFKRTLLIIVSLLVVQQPKSVEALKNKKVISSIIQLINPKHEVDRMRWTSEQCQHLFKYATNALSYLAPKMPKEFIECGGSLRLFLKLKEFLDENFDLSKIPCFVEMLSVLICAKCDLIRKDFQNHAFNDSLHEMIIRFMKFEAITLEHQKIMIFLLTASENIRPVSCCRTICNCGKAGQIINMLLKRCLQKKYEDSELRRSYLVAIGSFLSRVLTDCTSCFVDLSSLYLVLDMIESSDLPVQNLYLGILNDLCERNKCTHFLFTWRKADKKRNLLTLLAGIWRKEQQLFKIKRSPEGCIEDTNEPIGDDDEWLYLYYTKSICTLGTAITTAIGPARQKIYHLKKLVMREIDKYQKGYYKVLYNQLSTEDRITMLEIDSYSELKVDEAALAMSKALKSLKVRALTKSRQPLKCPNKKLGNWGARVRDAQQHLLELRDFTDELEERRLFQCIRDSNLSIGFDAMRNLDHVGRTGSRKYALAKCEEQRNMAEGGIARIRSSEPCFRTFDNRTNITLMFNRAIKVKSIEKKQIKCDIFADLKAISTHSLTKSDYEPPKVSSKCSINYPSESSFLLKNFQLGKACVNKPTKSH